ncbi:MAG: mammalian cell entry protein, partial [Pseudomonadota bacterium]
TGQLMIELDFYPNKEAKVVGDGQIPEIPTMASSLEELSRTLENIPFADIINKLTNAVAGIEKLVNSPELASSLGSLTTALTDMQSLIRNVDTHLDPLAAGVNSAVSEYGQLAKNINGEIGKLASATTGTLKAVEAASGQAEKLLAKAADATGEGSPVMYELRKALQELSAAAQALRGMADYLERHPESLLYGKGGSKQ